MIVSFAYTHGTTAASEDAIIVYIYSLWHPAEGRVVSPRHGRTCPAYSCSACLLACLSVCRRLRRRRHHLIEIKASLHGAALVHAISGNMEETSACLAQMRCIVEEDWARRRGRRGRTAAATEGTSHASLVVMETLDAYLAASRVSFPTDDGPRGGVVHGQGILAVCTNGNDNSSQLFWSATQALYSVH